MSTQSSKGMHIGLWVAQGLMAAMFLMAGFMKLAQPIPELAASLPWVEEFPELLVRFIGLSEVLGAIGLILPAALRIQPKLTPYAATGLAVVMVLALVFHLSRGEFEAAPMNVILFGILAFIAWGRSKKAPIAPKNQLAEERV